MHILLDELQSKQENYPDEAYPKVSFIVPTYNSALPLPRTLESLLDQEYPDFEIIVVDASSSDRTIEVVKSYGSDRIRVYSVSHYHPFEMLNKGISLATGEYLNFLRPGDTFLSSKVIKWMMTLALSNNNPELIYAASLVRMRWSDISLWFSPLDREFLGYGEEPSFLESCFFEKNLFQEIGKFDTSYEMRSDFDLFCRFYLKGNLRTISTSRVIVDYDEKGVHRKEIWQHFKETWKILFHHFGFRAAFTWLLFQEDLEHVVTLSLRDIKKAFVGA